MIDTASLINTLIGIWQDESMSKVRRGSIGHRGWCVTGKCSQDGGKISLLIFRERSHVLLLPGSVAEDI